LFGLLAACGCERAPVAEYGLGAEAEELSVQLRANISLLLEKHCGTPQAPKMLGDASMDVEHLKRGMQVYMHRCQQCHGVSGDGAGPAAKYLYPAPRDYRRGMFKFTSTAYGSKPRRDDLLRTLQRGIPGTSMPSFARLSKSDLSAVVDYVLVLTHRGELETLLVLEADPDEPAFDPEIVEEFIDDIKLQWNQAEYSIVSPLTPQPEFTAEDIEVGKELFVKIDCVKCHGLDGRGQTPANVVTPLKDMWGHEARAADLTAGILRGGSRPVDIYRRIYSGINGTPMPGFQNVEQFREDPELIWKLVSFVLSVSERRRAGNVPAVGQFTFSAPLPTAKKQTESAAVEP